MTSSADAARAPIAADPIGEMPPTLQSMWRLCKLGYRHEPRLMLVAFVLSQLSALPDALLALWLALLGKGLIDHRGVLVQVAAVDVLDDEDARLLGVLER